MLDEFIDAYSDDQICLEMIEKLVNEHPVEGNTRDIIKYSSFSRLWIVMMVGSIEMMVKKWAFPLDSMSDISTFMDNGSNEERLKRLFDAFKNRGLKPEQNLFDDYLACKYIRNAYIHGDWNETQRDYVTQKGFPKTLMKFDSTHLNRAKKSYYHLMNNLGMIMALEKSRTNS